MLFRSAQQSRFSKHTSDALRALSFLIHDLEKRRTVSEITDEVAKAVSIATKRVQNELEEATELISSVAITSTNTAEELQEECHCVIAELKGVVESVITSKQRELSRERRSARSSRRNDCNVCRQC